METIKETVKLLEKSSFYYTLIVALDNTYYYVSPHYTRNFDFLNESLVGKPFHITLHPDDIKVCEQVGGSCFANPDKLMPATLRKHDGKGGYVFTQWEFKAVFDDDGQPFGIFCMGHNITEQVTTGYRLNSAMAEIEDKKDKLYEIGFVQSHVVRKPLANILGLASVLTSMEIDHNLMGITSMIIDSATELDNAIKSIVDKTAE
jgi:hypothetical protein